LTNLCSQTRVLARLIGLRNPAVVFLRLLIIEDEPLIAADLESIAEGRDHVVVAVADTKSSALHLARTQSCDAALVDLRLNDGFTGIDIGKAFSSEFGLPFAFVTGNKEQLPEAAFGAVAVVQKPFTDDEIVSVLEALARRVSG
jgi:CheY-like chemotaxis protein